MEIVRFTYRVPKELLAKIKILATDNGVSINEEINQLVALGIESYLSKMIEIRSKL